MSKDNSTATASNTQSATFYNRAAAGSGSFGASIKARTNVTSLFPVHLLNTANLKAQATSSHERYSAHNKDYRHCSKSDALLKALGAEQPIEVAPVAPTNSFGAS